MSSPGWPQTSIKRHKSRSNGCTFKQNVFPHFFAICHSHRRCWCPICVLGVTLDPNLSMSQHINNTCKTAYIQIRHISSKRHLLTTPATQTLVGSLVLSRLDYCTSLLSGCPQYRLEKLQKVQNAAARIVCKAKKSDHTHSSKSAQTTSDTPYSI